MIKNATFGAGCFWCVEYCFKKLKGVVDVKPGYAGGHTEFPTYEEVCSETTGHVEVVRVTYDSSIITFEELLEVFWFVHNPTHLNHQGNDIGTRYRSVIFAHDSEQEQIATAHLEQLKEAKIWEDPIVTSIEPLTTYFEAENYHHDYVIHNPENQYCQFVVKPKIEKFEKVFANKIS